MKFALLLSDLSLLTQEEEISASTEAEWHFAGVW